MIEIGFEEFADYWFEKWKSLVTENEKLRIHNKNLLDKINEQRGQLIDWEHKFNEVLERESHTDKECKRLQETVDSLYEKINELQDNKYWGIK